MLKMASTLGILIIVACTLSACIALDATSSCSSVANFYDENYGDSGIILSKAALAEGRNVCGGVYTCCAMWAEDQIVAYSMKNIEAAVVNKSGDLATLFSQKFIETDRFFQDLIDDSKQSLHSLFSTTYGDVYKQSASVFMKFFDDLKSYYNGGEVDLGDMFDGFFTTLMQRVFKLLNPSYDVNDDYMQCIADNINVISPFADIPKKLANQVQRSFIAARTFAEALKTGERVTRGMMTDMTSTSLSLRVLPKNGVVNYAKMAHCSKCNGYVDMKPCMETCNLAFDESLCGLSGDIGIAWAKYIDGIMAVIQRLERPFDVEAVLSPLDVKISEAIMMLQDNRQSIAEAVTRQCGELPKNPDVTFFPDAISPLDGFRPSSDGGFQLMPDFLKPSGDSGLKISDGPTDPLAGFDLTGLQNLDLNGLDVALGKNKKSKRTKRAADSGKRKRKNAQRRRKNGRKHHRERAISPSEHKLGRGDLVPQPEDTGAHFEDLIKEFKSNQKFLKYFWRRLPENICDSMAETTPGGECWNGESVSTYTPELATKTNMNTCTDEQNTLSALVRRQIVILKDMTEKLRQAHRGVDASFVDREMTGDYEYSGDGSGEDDEEDVPHPKKDKLVLNLEDWEVELLNHALGRSVDNKSKLKDVKHLLQHHPHLRQNNEHHKKSEENFGDLTVEQQKNLKKILGIQKNTDEQDKVVTKPPFIVPTTSSALTSKLYSLPVMALMLFFSLF